MEKKVTIISSVNLTLFKGLSQEDLTIDNKAEHNRLNIRPLWASRVDEKGQLQRIDFVRGENEVPEYVLEWDSFRKLADNGTLNVKGSYTKQSVTDTKSLEEIKKLQEEVAQLRAEKEKLEAETKKTKVKTIEA